MPDQSECPLVIQRTGRDRLTDMLQDRRWEHRLRRHGALLFRGFEILTPEAFGETLAAASPAVMEYEYQSAPRTELAPHVYTATERPSWVRIAPHHEVSYRRDWPMTLLFGCLAPATTGGELLLGRTSAITDSIDRAVRDELARREVMYVRNYRRDIDVPWQRAFGTSDRGEVERACRASGMALEWRDDELRTRHVAQAVATHPHTGDVCWFNQLHSYHPSYLDQRTRAELLRRYGADGLPRNAFYGDGAPIPDDVAIAIRRAFDAEVAPCRCERGDVVMLDNMLVTHGRTPYTGSRTMVVGMADRYSEAAAGVVHS